MMYLIIYDIGLDRIRTRIAKRLVAEGYLRLQLSVFVGIKHPKANILLWKDINQWLKEETSSKFYILQVTKTSFRKMNIIGDSKLNLAYIMGEQHTLFI